MIEQCSVCNKSLGTIQQGDLFNAPKKCIQCQTNDRIGMILNVLPAEDELAFSRLSDFEQGFLTSVRSQFNRKNTLSEKQYAVLERIYERTA